MGHPDRKRPVFIFLYNWRGSWAGEYQAVSLLANALALTFVFQAFPSAGVIFAGIGILLSVGVIHGSLRRLF